MFCVFLIENQLFFIFTLFNDFEYVEKTSQEFELVMIHVIF